MTTQQTQHRAPRAPSEPFEEFVQALYNHHWSHGSDNYRDYIRAVKKEDELFARAMQHAIPGLDAFRAIKEESLMTIVSAAVRQAEQDLTSRFQARIDNLRAKYMSPLDVYKEKLEQHDWLYSGSDDNGVYRRGVESEHALVLEANGRPSYERQTWIDAYRAMHNKYFKDTLLSMGRWDCMVTVAQADRALNNSMLADKATV